jgi:hypothetical protein
MELCTWVTLLITLPLQKCFVINVMNKSGSIHQGNLYLSVISCQLGKLVQMSVKSHL